MFLFYVCHGRKGVSIFRLTLNLARGEHVDLHAVHAFDTLSLRHMANLNTLSLK